MQSDTTTHENPLVRAAKNFYDAVLAGRSKGFFILQQQDDGTQQFVCEPDPTRPAEEIEVGLFLAAREVRSEAHGHR